jgi:hypothetical protein
MLRIIPLQTLVVVAYFAIAFTVPTAVDGVALAFTLPSGAPWTLTTGGVLVAVGLFLLYLEVLKSVRTTMASLIDHGLSLLLFSICLILFIVVPQAGTATFFLILIMCLIDVIAGFTVSLAASRRSIDVGTGM